MSAKCSNLYVIIIDEIENVGMEIFGMLEQHVQDGTTSTHPYKFRRFQGKDHKELRRFGGINLFLLGDFWQLPPVGDVQIMANPFRGASLYSAMMSRSVALFWSKGSDSIQTLFELTVNNRSGQDSWYQWRDIASLFRASH